LNRSTEASVEKSSENSVPGVGIVVAGATVVVEAVVVVGAEVVEVLVDGGSDVVVVEELGGGATVEVVVDGEEVLGGEECTSNPRPTRGNAESEVVAE
jgi:hypothetical protein